MAIFVFMARDSDTPKGPKRGHLIDIYQKEAHDLRSNSEWRTFIYRKGPNVTGPQKQAYLVGGKDSYAAHSLDQSKFSRAQLDSGILPGRASTMTFLKRTDADADD